MKYICPQCGKENEISLAQSASALGKEGIKTILQTPELTRKDWQKKGGTVRAAKYSKEQIKAWCRLGGRPKKKK